jgi:predicted Zn-dependent protease
MRTRLAAICLATLAVATAWAVPARGATPPKGRLAAGAPTVTWKGTATVANPATCTSASDPTCDHFALTVEPVAGKDVKVTVTMGPNADFDLYVYGPDGSQVAAGPGGFMGETESAVFRAVKKGTYEVRVQPFAVTPGETYKGRAAFVDAAPAKAGDAEKTDCSEDVPHEASPGLTDDQGGTVKLSVLLLLDGVDAKVATDAAKKAVRSYAPLKVAFSVDRMTPVAIKPDKTGNTANAQRMLDDARALVGGARPAGFDVVFVMTKKDIYDDVLGNGVVGMADCIGGVEDPKQAFAVGEVADDELELLVDGGPRMYVDTTAKILAHEVGHLLGAQHHYANCVEGIGSNDVSDRDVSPCTLMSNFVDFQSLRIDTLNGAVVRGHASSYARP